MEKFKLIELIIFLKSIKGLGDIRIKRIINYYQGLEELLNDVEAGSSENILEQSVKSELQKSIKSLKKFSSEFERFISELEKKKIKFTTLKSKNYPKNLKNITDPPPILYYKGNLTCEDKYSISIVGTRRPSPYGRMVCEMFAKELSGNLIPVISGMAYGVDSIAHTVSINNSNVTYAVLGSGVDIVYPPGHKPLYEKIIESGAVISEFEPGAEPEQGFFPRRNRIISGIGLGVIVIETAMKGGSLITANLALDQNREVFAVPGNINVNTSKGTNDLIKRGLAKPVTNIEDVFQELEFKLKPVLKKDEYKAKESIIKNLNKKESQLFNVIGDNPMNIDQISELSKMNITDCLVNLLSLEFKGIIKQLPGKNFIRLC